VAAINASAVTPAQNTRGLINRSFPRGGAANTVKIQLDFHVAKRNEKKGHRKFNFRGQFKYNMRFLGMQEGKIFFCCRIYVHRAGFLPFRA
jgi:hypothetical protein